MKPGFARRYRRRSAPSRSEGTFFKKESQESFFGGAEHESFFQPAHVHSPSPGINRKCEECEKEDKQVQREPEKKEEEKIMKMEDKKEEEKVQREPEKKEEEKVMKMEDKKEEEKVQREPEKKEEEKVMKMEDKKEEEKVQREPEKKEEEKLQKKEAGSSQTTATQVSSYIGSLSGKGQPLPANANHFFSSRMGYDFSNVKVHNDKEAAESAREINAKAYTIRNNIVFNQGQFSTESHEGKKLIAHELTHVIQQDDKIQKKEPAPEEGCPGYSPGEITKSRSSAGFLPDDVVMHKSGELLIADYGNDWGSPKLSALTHPLLTHWLSVFETDPTYRISIVGYSDCIGSNSLNIDLRHRRAKKIENILGAGALTKLKFRGMAGLGDFVADNSTKEGRAKNRGVVIQFHREITMDPEQIIANPFCGPDSAQWLVDQMNRNKDHPVIKTNRNNSWAWKVPFFNLGWLYGFFSDFRDLVKAGGPWDFKSKKFWRYENGKICPSEKCDKTVTICGHCLNYDVPGNIHYGWVGRAGGIRRWFLLNRAAAAQKGGVDDPKDVAGIDIGIRMWENGTALCDEINSNLGKLNADGTKDCTLCGNKLI